MNKSQLINAISSKTNLKKKDVKKAIDAFMQITKEELKNEKKITLLGFGTFSTVNKKERKGLNPKTNTSITIPAKRSPKFRAGKDLIKVVNY